MGVLSSPGSRPTRHLGRRSAMNVLADSIWSLRPLFHAKVYEVFGSVDLEVDLDPPARSERLVHASQPEGAPSSFASREQRTRLRWSTDRSWSDKTYDLFVIIYVPAGRHLLVCTTRRQNAVYDALVNSVVKGSPSETRAPARSTA